MESEGDDPPTQSQKQEPQMGTGHSQIVMSTEQDVDLEIKALGLVKLVFCKTV